MDAKQNLYWSLEQFLACLQKDQSLTVKDRVTLYTALTQGECKDALAHQEHAVYKEIMLLLHKQLKETEALSNILLEGKPQKTSKQSHPSKSHEIKQNKQKQSNPKSKAQKPKAKENKETKEVESKADTSSSSSTSN